MPGAAGAKGIARDAALIIAGSLLVALCAQIKLSLGFTPVPVTGQTFAVLLVGALLAGWRGGLALALYAVEGAFLPFFAGGASGWFWTLPSGGFIVGFIPAAALVGWLCQRGWCRHPWVLAAMLLGNAVLYLPGLLQLALFLPAARPRPGAAPRCGSAGCILSSPATWQSWLRPAWRCREDGRCWTGLP